ncbi:MAG: hypothetical protein FVQ81_13900 [Candidatus Glassbacteria bacterium]|nr:hypothetical protein [Candidatus Glassbacteria bacterium]
MGSEERYAYRRANQFEGLLLNGQDPERELQRIKQEEKAKQITLKEFFPEYLQRHGPHLSEKTKEHYRYRYKMISKCHEILRLSIGPYYKKDGPGLPDAPAVPGI